MGRMDRLDRIIALVRTHRPNLRLVHKQRIWWMRMVGVMARPIVPDFNTRFTTVVGDTVYLPCPVDEFPRDALAATLAHELVHQLDQRRWGPVFYASYGVALPTIRSMRAYWERRAYAVDLLLAWERGGAEELERVLTRLVTIFAGPAYAWMWAGRLSARAYLDPVAQQVRDGTLAQEEPYRSILGAWRGPPVASGESSVLSDGSDESVDAGAVRRPE